MEQVPNEKTKLNQSTSNPPPSIIPIPQSIDAIYDNSLFTKYPILISLCVFSSLLVDGVEMNLMNLLIIPLGEFYDLSQFRVELVASILFIGVGLGSLSSHIFTANIGRVNTLFFSLFTLLISHTMMAISIDIYMFILFRVVIGPMFGPSTAWSSLYDSSPN